MVDAELVEDGGVEVLYGDFVFDDVVGVFVGFAEGGAAFDAAAGHPGREAFRVVVAAVVIAFQFPLAVGGAAELSGEDHESVIEHAALFEVINEAGAGLVDVVGLSSYFFGKVDVVVPAAVEELDEADATLGHAAGEETVAGEGTGLGDFGAVELFVGGFVFAGEIGELGNGGLHAEGHLLLGDGGLDFGVADFGHLLFVELGDEIEHLMAGFAGDLVGIGEEEDGVARGLEGDALVFRGQEAGAPEAGVESLDVLFVTGPEGGVEDDEVGEVFVHAAEAVGEPSAHRGFAGDFGAGAEEGFAGVVVDGGGGSGLDEGEVIGDRTEVGEDLGEVHAALAMGVKLKHGGGNDLIAPLGHGGDALAFGDGFREGFFEALMEVGLVVKEVELGGGSGHEEEDDAFGRGFGKQVGVSIQTSGGAGDKVSEDGATKAHAGGVEELAACLWVEHEG